MPFMELTRNKLANFWSDKVINRLTIYRSILLEYEEKGVVFISSPQIAALMKIDHSQVRKDIQKIYHAGKRKVGYHVKDLRIAIEAILGLSEIKKIFIVGAGNLGTAFAKYNNFEQYGFQVVALFDNDPIKIGIVINGKTVFALAELPNLIKEQRVNIAILTVPQPQAQRCADFLIASGIQYLWNFTPVILKVPDTVQVLNENLIGSFLRFFVSHQLCKN